MSRVIVDGLSETSSLSSGVRTTLRLQNVREHRYVLQSWPRFRFQLAPLPTTFIQDARVTYVRKGHPGGGGADVHGWLPNQALGLPGRVVGRGVAFDHGDYVEGHVHPEHVGDEAGEEQLNSDEHPDGHQTLRQDPELHGLGRGGSVARLEVLFYCWTSFPSGEIMSVMHVCRIAIARNCRTMICETKEFS